MNKWVKKKWRNGRGLALFTVILLWLLLNGCADEPREGAAYGPVLQTGGTFVSVDIQNDPDVVSPIRLHEPALRCGTAISVSGFAPGATLQILAGGVNVIGEEIGYDPQEQLIELNVPLEDDWILTAVQKIDGETSAPSNQVEVQDYTEAYPSGLPRPEINYLPLYRCGIATVAENLPQGGQVRILSDAVTDPIGRANGIGTGHTIGIHPPFEVGHGITAISSICDIESQPSEPPRIVQPEPASLPAPGVPELYENGAIIIVGNLVNGARVTIRDQATGTPVAGGGAPANRVRFRASTPVTGGQVLEVEETLCDLDVTTTVTVNDCSRLPAPIIIGPQPGDTQVYLTNVVAGSRILIYASSEEIADGGASPIQLTRAVAEGEILTAVQILGNCRSSNGYQVTVGTGLNDPGIAGACQVQSLRYGESSAETTDISNFFDSPYATITESMDAVPLRGIVYYPVSSHGRYPLFMIVHGNTSSPDNAGYDGYNYLLEHLASHCIVAVSIDEYFLNGDGVSGEMDARGIMLLRHLQMIRKWDQDPMHDLYSKIDYNNVMVSGHSRGGEAAVVATKFNTWLHNPSQPDFDFNFGIRAIYAIAPVDGQISWDTSAPLSGLPLRDMTVDSADYFVIHGSHDGDVATFDGQRTYDRAFPVTSDAGHLKALRFVHGANHRQFNSFWATLPPDHTPTALTTDVQNLNRLNLTAYAFATLKGWLPYRAFLKREVTFASMPAGMTVVRQYQDPERRFINHYEEDDDEASASLPGVTNDIDGVVSSYEDIYFYAPGPPHWLWEQTDGLLLGWGGGTDGVYDIKLTGNLDTLISDYPVLSFRVGQVFDESGAINPDGVDKNFTVRIQSGAVSGPGALISDYVSLVSAVDVPGTWTDLHLGYKATKTIMSSVRIPWAHLLPAEYDGFNTEWEIRFELDQHTTGLLVLDEIQASE